MSNVSDWIERYERWHDAHGVKLALRGGAREADLSACERVIGRALPADFRAFLLRHDGQEMEQASEFAPGCNWLAPASIIAKQWLDEAQWAEDGDEGGEPQCRGRVRSVVFDKGRIPIAGSQYWDGDRLYLDFAPGPAGQAGQVIALTSECDFAVLGESFGDFMRSYVALLESGELRAAVDGLALPAGYRGHPAEWLAARLVPSAPTVSKPRPTAAKSVAAKSVAAKSTAAKSTAAKSVAAKSVAAKSVAAKSTAKKSTAKKSKH